MCLHYHILKTQWTNINIVILVFRAERNRLGFFLSSNECKCYKHEWRYKINTAKQEMVESITNFAFLKIHMLLHFAHIVASYDVLSALLMENTELIHCPTLKVAYAYTNHANNYEVQMLQYGLCHDAFREVELEYDELNRDYDDSNSNSITNSEDSLPPVLNIWEDILTLYLPHHTKLLR